MSLYKLLNVTSTATLKEIQQSFRKLALEYHPDRHPNMSTASKKVLEEQFKAITDAYDVLSNTESRKLYDISIGSTSSYSSYSDTRAAYNDFDFSSSSYYNSSSSTSSRFYKSSKIPSGGPIPSHLFNVKEWEEAHYGVFDSIYFTAGAHAGVMYSPSWMNHTSKNNNYFYKKHLEDLKKEQFRN